MIETGLGIGVLILLGIIALFIYFLPTFIARGRNSTMTFVIFLINLFGGWTVALWVLVLVLAITTKRK